MSLWGSVLLVSVVWLAVGLAIAVFLAKLLKLSRLAMEDYGITGAAKAIRKFLDREQTPDVQFHIRRYDHYDEIIPEEEAGIPEACVVCQAYGRKDLEDARPPLVVISESHIPLCEGHKLFVREFEEEIRRVICGLRDVTRPPFE